jgi:hypothetical protein
MLQHNSNGVNSGEGKRGLLYILSDWRFLFGCLSDML